MIPLQKLIAISTQNQKKCLLSFWISALFLTGCNNIIANSELILEDVTTVTRPGQFPEGESRPIVHIYNLKCAGVHRVKYQLSMIKEGQSQIVSDWYSIRTKDKTKNSNRCTFLIVLPSSNQNSQTPPWMKFIYGGKDGLSEGGTDYNIDFPDTKKTVWDYAPQELSIPIETTKDIYVGASGSQAAIDELSDFKLRSVEQLKTFSKQHQNVTFTAVTLSWSKSEKN